VELISRAIVDEPPLPVKEGGMIRDGFDAALDELRTPSAAARIGSPNCRRTKSRAPASRR
jgi:DNA mismatch repair ATPase MutS